MIETQTQDNKQIASTLWRQVPMGNKMRLGAHKLQVTERGLRFKVGMARLTYVEITLDHMDTYTVCVTKYRGGVYTGRKELYKAEGVYWDMLGSILDAADHAIWPR